MAIPVFNESTMRYHDPETGRMVKSSTASLGSNLGAVGSNLGTDGSILDALNRQTQLLTEVRDGMFGTAAEQRDELIGREDTDLDSGGIEPVTSGDRIGFVDTLKGMNPFSGGIGTKMTLALLAGALFALTKLGPDITEKLSAFLKWVKEDAMTDIADGWEKLKEGFSEKWNKAKEFFTWIKDDFVPSLQKLYDDSLLWWDKQWPKVTNFFAWMKGIFTDIGDYIDTWDTDGTPGLSKEEIKAGLEDIATKTWNTIIDAAGGWVIGLGGALLAYAIGMPLYKAGVAIAGAKIAAAVAGGGTAATAGAAGPNMISRMAASGTLTKIGLAGLIAGSLIGIYSAGKDALVGAVDEETGKIDKSKFAALFLAGDEEGGFGAAIRNAFTGGPTAAGALIGVSLGVAGGPFGMLVGGLMGAAIGGVVGGIAGYIGPDGIEKVIDGTVGQFKSAIDDISTFFGSFFAGIQSWAQGDSFEYGQKKFLAENADQTRSEEIAEEKAKLEQQLQEQIDNPAGSARGQNDALRKLKSKINNLNREQTKLDEASVFLYNDAITERNEAKEILPGLYAELADQKANPANTTRAQTSAINRIQNEIRKYENQASSAESTMLSSGLMSPIAIREGTFASQPIIKNTGTSLSNYSTQNMNKRQMPGGSNVIINKSDNKSETVIANGSIEVNNLDKSSRLAGYNLMEIY